MANYFMDCEFLEGTQDKRFLGIKYDNTKPTIDLISIGIVSEDNREFYAISKEFNLKEAWNRFDLKINKHYPSGSEYNKEYWIRNNVLKSIYLELITKENNMDYVNCPLYKGEEFKLGKLEYKQLEYLIDKYGKTNKEIAKEIITFTNKDCDLYDALQIPFINFYGYYCDYDWVAFCWLFGNMIDLPKGFPMYCNDLKQTFDENFKELNEHEIVDIKDGKVLTNSGKVYPKQVDEHNALSDAKWNKKLYNFLSNL